MSCSTPYDSRARTGFHSFPSRYSSRHQAGTRTSPRPVVEPIDPALRDRGRFLESVLTHSDVPFRGHRSKKDVGSFDAAGSSPSLMARRSRRAWPDTVALGKYLLD